MRTKSQTVLWRTALLAISTLLLQFQVFGQGTAFSHNCYLTQNGSVLNGRYDLEFSLFDANTGGTQSGGTLTTAGASVSAGLHTALLDFGPGIFTGQPRWLQIGIRSSGSGTYTLLARQPLTPTPYAIFAGSSGGGSGNQWLSSESSIYYNGGNVGIGTAIPNYNLEVIGAANVKSGFLQVQHSVAPQLYFYSPQNHQFLLKSDGHYPDSSFSIREATFSLPGTSLLTLQSGGKVGIGTSNPSRALEVVSPTGDAEIGVRSGDPGGRLWTIQSSRATEGDDLDGTFQIIDRTAGESRFTISRDGGVTVGSLYSKNDIRAGGDMSVRGSISTTAGFINGYRITSYEDMRCIGYYYCLFDGAYYALDKEGRTAVWSDQRLKRQIITIPNAAEAVAKLRGVTYSWNEAGLQHITRDIEKKWKSLSGKPEDDQKLWAEKRKEEQERLSKPQIGFVAQEVEEVFPDWVSTDKTGYKRVNLEHLNALVVNAINEQQGEIAALRKQLAAETTVSRSKEKELAQVRAELTSQKESIRKTQDRLMELQNAVSRLAGKTDAAVASKGSNTEE